MEPKRSILLVDDEASILRTLQMVFEHEGYNVSTAKSSGQAIAMLASNGHFDAVVTDLNMERDDVGLEVARAAVKRTPRPAVIVCTGFASVKNSRIALEIGIDYMAHKPVELEDLISALNRLISRHSRS